MAAFNWYPGLTVALAERTCIEEALRYFQGNKTQTAIALGLSEKTVRVKLDQYAEEQKIQEESDYEERQRKASILARMRGLPQGQTQIEMPKIQADARNGMESAPPNFEKQPLPLPQREEVQKLSPRKTRKERADRHG